MVRSYKTLSLPWDKSHITCPALLAYLPTPWGNRSKLPPSRWHSCNFPSTKTPIMCRLMKCYTFVTIIQLDTGASGMYRISAPGWWKHGSISTASLSHSSYFHFIVCLSHSTKLHWRPAPFVSSSIWLLFYFYARADNRGTCEGQVWVSGQFSSCWWFPLCQSPKQGGNIQFNVTFLCSSSTVRLTASTRAQVKFQIRNPFYPQWRNHSTYSPFPESNSYASKGRSIEYLWVTGLGNSV